LEEIWVRAGFGRGIGEGSGVSWAGGESGSERWESIDQMSFPGELPWFFPLNLETTEEGEFEESENESRRMDEARANVRYMLSHSTRSWGTSRRASGLTRTEVCLMFYGPTGHQTDYQHPTKR